MSRHQPSAISYQLFKEAKRFIPGGVNSPVRAFGAVGGSPIFIEKAKGSKVYSVDGKSYIDYVMSWGVLILGHSNPSVIRGVKKVIENGTSFGAPTKWEIELAKVICALYPSIELVRLVNSGTEAAMSAIRVARGYTKRDKIIKFEGCYHGHADYFLVAAGSGAATFGMPNSLGVPEDIAKDTLVLPYNDLTKCEDVFKKFNDEIAAIIVEPVAANIGVVLPKRGFLEGLRKLCDRYGVVLIFDEVITGFRVGLGGAQEKFKVKPDLTCLGKIIGGGFPIGAYGGRKEIMENVAPLGGVYQAGTLSGNPVAVQAGLATLELLEEKNLYKELEDKTVELCDGIEKAATEEGVSIKINRISSMFTLFFTDEEVLDFDSAKRTNTSQFAKFFRTMLDEGIYIPPSNFEAWFVSKAHKKDDIKKTIDSSGKAFRILRRQG